MEPAFRSAHYLFLSWARSIQSIHPHPTCWKYMLYHPPIYSYVFQVASFPQVFPPKPCTRLPSPLSSMRATCPAHLIRIDFITRTLLGEPYRSLSCSLWSFLQSPVTPSLLGRIFSSAPYFQTSLPYVLPSKSVTKFYTHTKQQAKLYFCIS